MPIQAPRPFKIDASLLETKSEPSDRFVYSAYYVAYTPRDPDRRLPIPPYRASYVARLAARMPSDVRSEVLRDEADILELAERYHAAETDMRSVPYRETGDVRSVPYRETGDAIIDRVANEITLLRTILTSRGPGNEAAISAARDLLLSGLERTATSAAVAATSPGDGEVRDPATIPPREVLRGALVSEIGFLFLDRTRIRPSGFAVGEHLLSLSLAPGEEVAIEQRVFSKREATYEEVSDEERLFDLELSSTLTAELTEGLDREQTRTTRTSDTLALQATGEIFGVNMNAGPSSSDSLDEADHESSRSSVKSSAIASMKVASKHRSQHKITVRVSTEARFEATARRVLKNPNQFTPIDLQYFKVLQRLKLSQERYGVRLCWAPAVRDPGSHVLARLEGVKTSIYAQVGQASAGPRPTPPKPPQPAAAPPPPPPPAPPPPKTESVTQEADQWNKVTGDQSHDYLVEIKAPSGYQWDGNTPSLTYTFTGSRPNWTQVNSAAVHGTGVKVSVHVGVEMQTWADSTGLHWEKRGSLHFTVSATFNALPAAPSAPTPSGPDPQAAYAAAVEAWKAADAEWQKKDAELKAAAQKKADQEWAEAKAKALADMNPLHEALAVMISKMFPSHYRDDIWEIDLWERIFDWPNAAMKLYPSWWVDTQPRDPKSGPLDFINASWARLFLPIRPGAETLALQWIFALTQSGKLKPKIKSMIDAIVKDLKAYRLQNFGDEAEVAIDATSDECPAHRERYKCLAQWEELVPTDGTHLEVLQATTMAADDDQRDRLQDAEKLREAQVARIEKNNAVRDAVLDQGVGTIDTDVTLHLGGDEPVP